MQKYVIALYIRLSLEDYKYDSMSIENQHLVLNEFVSSMPESTDAEVLEFIDNGYSGTNFERPKVQELIELVRANQIDCIIVKDCRHAYYFTSLIFFKYAKVTQVSIMIIDKGIKKNHIAKGFF